MRILTPAEVRQVEAIKRGITKGSITDINLASWIMTTEESKAKRDLWLNILNLALQQSESLKKEWVKS